MTAPALNASEFEILADETLERMVEALSDLEDDRLEADLESGVLTVRFEDGAKYVVNSHRAALQIWMAAGTTAWHFSWNGQEWRSSKSDDELWATVNDRIGAKLGQPLDLRS
ncbi:MAG: iron donor protein CyaY [Myxococcota bacterium]